MHELIKMHHFKTKISAGLSHVRVEPRDLHVRINEAVSSLLQLSGKQTPIFNSGMYPCNWKQNHS